jgi:hypothetical protein
MKIRIIAVKNRSCSLLRYGDPDLVLFVIPAQAGIHPNPNHGPLPTQG